MFGRLPRWLHQRGLVICVLSLVVLFLPDYAVTALSPVAVMTLEEWGNVLIQ